MLHTDFKKYSFEINATSHSGQWAHDKVSIGNHVVYHTADAFKICIFALFVGLFCVYVFVELSWPDVLMCGRLSVSIYLYMANAMCCMRGATIGMHWII